MSSFFSKMGYSAIYVYVEFFIGLVASVLIARTLGPDHYGIFSYFMKISAILLLIINGGVSTGVLRFLVESMHGQKNEKVIAYRVYRHFSKMLLIKCFVILLIFYLVLQRALGVIVETQYEPLLLLFLLGVVFKSYHMFRVGALKGLERFDKLAWVVLLVSPLYLISVIVGNVKHENIHFFAIVYLLTCILYSIASYVLIAPSFQKGQYALGDQFKKRALSYVRVVTINTILGSFMMGYMENFYLKFFQSNQQIGFFNIGLTFSMAAINIVPGIYNSILMPAMVKNTVQNEGKGNDNARLFVFGTIRHMLLLTLFVIAPAAYYSKNLVLLFYGAEYRDAIFPLMMLFLGSIATALVSPANAYFASKDRQGELLKLNGIAVFLSVVLGYFLIKLFGLKGAVISNVAVTTFGALYLLGMLLKEFKSIPQPSRFAKIICASALSIFAASFVHVGGNLWLEMIGGSMVYALLFVCLVICLNAITEDEKKAVVKVLRKLLRIQ